MNKQVWYLLLYNPTFCQIPICDPYLKTQAMNFFLVWNAVQNLDVIFVAPHYTDYNIDTFCSIFVIVTMFFEWLWIMICEKFAAKQTLGH
jgi:hypothetical protein